MIGPSTVMQPGSALPNLSLAGAWARSVLTRLDVTRTATATLTPETFDEFGSAMSAVLAFYLAVDHARVVARETPWIGTWPMDTATMDDLHGRASRFRDFLMHVEDKLHRPSPYHEAAAKRQAQSDTSPRPYGYVTTSFGFEGACAVLYAPVERTTKRSLTRLSWDEIEQASRAIESWVIDLLSRWPEIEQRWAPYVEVQGHKSR